MVLKGHALCYNFQGNVRGRAGLWWRWKSGQPALQKLRKHCLPTLLWGKLNGSGHPDLLMRPHITYMHNEPCATLAQHFCNNLGWFALKDDKGWQGTTLFAPICDVLYHSTIPYSAPFHIYYLFWPFLTFWIICNIVRFCTFPYSAWLCSFFQHVSSDPFHMIITP